MERYKCRRSDMPRSVGAFIDPLNGKVISVTFESGLVSMKYINDDQDKPRVVTVADFNDGFLKNLIPVPMRIDGPIKE